MNETKKVALRIGLLYAITSFIFLLIIFYVLYEQEERSIIDLRASALRDVNYSLETNLRNNYSNFKEILDLFSSDNNIGIVIGKESGNSIYNNSSLSEYEVKNLVYKDKGIFTRYIGRSKIIIDNDDAILVSYGVDKAFYKLLNEKYSKDKKEHFFILIVSSGMRAEFISLFLYMLASFIASLVGIGFIAYFLVRFSLRPLEIKIESLNRFIKDSTHEINTPLSVILMSLERIKLDHMDSQNITKLERIKMAAKSLEQIYQDLIYYSFPHLHDKKIEDIDMEVLVKERVDYFRPFFDKKNIEISINTNKSTLKAHKNGMIRVIDNLLDNALKYTPNNGFVKLILQEDGFEINDNGCGIKSDLLPRIFDRYYRANKHQGGFGIGLSLIVDICAMYDIKISCNSVEGVGTTFKLNWNRF